MTRVITRLWTDGSGTRSGPIGFAWVLEAINRDTGQIIATKRGEGSERDGTANRAELLAVITGLLELSRPAKVKVISDSAYVVQNAGGGRLTRWKGNGWQMAHRPENDRHADAEWMCPLCASPGRAPDEPCERHAPSVPKHTPRNVMAIANRDLWQLLSSAMEIHDLSFEQVKGHSGLEHNDDCDARAGAARKALVAKLSGEQAEAA